MREKEKQGESEEQRVRVREGDGQKEVGSGVVCGAWNQDRSGERLREAMRGVIMDYGVFFLVLFYSLPSLGGYVLTPGEAK